MNETNGAKVGDLLGPLFFGDENNTGGVEPMEVACLKI
jgi:hypothetical protein